MTESLKHVLMSRDGVSADEADEMIQDAAQRVFDGDDPEDVLQEEFGLEPDYVFDLLEALR